ncbi:MAG: UDP-N-acetylmuramate--L-alanine ligase [Bdellovibrionales bacterium]|nr:UDP-N-acetylmuramate--L-alanine ligase [Bdellovibrionales bacterium]
MSGIAEILLCNGFRVSGSDMSSGPICDRLQSLGATIFTGHSTEHLPSEASLVVYSSAVPLSNPEVMAAKSRGIPVVKRAEVLAELMRLKFGVGVAGSHGKTTTTTIVGWILNHAELDPTIIVGGQVQSFGSGGRAGKSSFLVAEADESDRSFLLLKPTIAVVTNVDREHLSAYRDEGDLRESFEQFVRSVPFYGLAVLCIDDPFLEDLAKRYERRKVTYGFSEAADVRGEVHGVTSKGVEFSVFVKGQKLFTSLLPMAGRHFAKNALAAVAVALEFGIASEKIAEALTSCPGVARRLECIGECDGALIYSDYGHHPVEIAATLSALDESYRQAGRRLRVVFQPHRYSRTVECFDQFLTAFVQCDELIVTEIYSAGESPIAEVSGELLASAIQGGCASYASTLEDAGKKLIETFSPEDVILFLGAGSIGKYSHQFFDSLKSSSSY